MLVNRIPRVIVALAILLASQVACGIGTGLGEPARPDHSAIEVTAEETLESWARKVGTPYRNASYCVLEGDDVFATVRIIAELKKARVQPWLEHEAEVECRKVGYEWRCSQWMSFELTQAGQEKAMAATARAAPNGTAEAQATAVGAAQAEASTREAEQESLAADPAGRDNAYSGPPEMQLDPGESYQATISTKKGNVVVDLDAEAAPVTVNNFVFLAREGFYDGLTFHRVVDGFVIQGGDPLGDGTGGPGYVLPAEIGLEHVKGAIAMARRGDQVNPERASSGSQFYITLDETPHLDGGYTVFGVVVAGMDVVESIEKGDVIETIAVTRH